VNIHNHLINNQTQNMTSVKPGEITIAQIKERTSDHTAVITIKGKDYKTEFKNEIPQTDKVSVKVIKTNGDHLQVETRVAPSTSNNNLEISKSIQVESEKLLNDPMLQELTNLLRKKGININSNLTAPIKEAVSTKFEDLLSRLTQNITGDLMNEIKSTRDFIQLSSNIEPIHLKTNELLNKLSAYINHQTIKDIKHIAQDVNRNPLVVKDNLIQMLDQVRNEFKQNISKNNLELLLKHSQDILNNVSRHLISEAKQSTQGEIKQQNNVITKQVIEQWLKNIQYQAKLKPSLEILKNELKNYSDSSAVKQINESIEKAAMFVESKKELAARKEIHQALEQLKSIVPSVSIENTENQRIHQDFKSYVEDIAPFVSKDIVVARVTEKLAKATIEFKQIQRELIRNLSNAENMLRNQNTVPQAKQLLESTIAKLDNTIMKSEMMILSDMGTEKKLMQASSQLAEAKNLLTNGKTFETQKIVQSIITMLEKINWKPSDVKVMHYTSALAEETTVPQYEKQLTKTITQVSNYSNMEYGSPREMYEKLRSIGLNYERDIGTYFTSNKPEHLLKDIESNNLKYLLLKMSGDDGTGKLSQQLEQTLSHITGQQLLSKSDHNSQQQSMMFSLPIQLQEQMSSIKVFVNSKKDGQKVDWENCSLYFLIETPKLGEVGILVSASERKLSLTLKNDSLNFETIAKPIGENAISKIEEIGYQINGMKFTKLNSEQENNISEKPIQNPTYSNHFSEKGLNFRI
jgi:uncharacterized protein YihD (DUF1040 family)